jgi:hypothetical protein
MRPWVILAGVVLVTTVAWTLVRQEDKEEMFIRIGGQDLRSLPM